MLEFTVKGDLKKTNSFLERCLNIAKLGNLDNYGRIGVEVLAAATPKDTENTANSWYYKIVRKKNSVSVQWLNSSQNQGVSIVILLQYGHGLKNGGYIEGIDFINPALKPVFQEMADNMWKELTDG